MSGKASKVLERTSFPYAKFRCHQAEFGQESSVELAIQFPYFEGSKPRLNVRISASKSTLTLHCPSHGPAAINHLPKSADDLVTLTNDVRI
jgi:hypothetical protein